jgi:hypothetical protein
MSELKESLTKKILSLPGVKEEIWPNESGGFISFKFKGKDFAHYHPSDEIDLRLTKKVIAAESVIRLPNSIVHPKRAKSSPWIEIRFSSEKDLNEIMRLVKLAIEQI